MSELESTIATYLEALEKADAGDAVRTLEDATSAGIGWDQLITDVIGPAQREVGERWMTGACTVADEHAATAVAEQAVAILTPRVEVTPSAKVVLLACAEGEWHTFGPRLVASMNAEATTMRLVQLGGSISEEHLRRYLHVSRPDALALSTTLSAHLIGAAHSIRAAVEESVPVIVGGAGWGGSSSRARRLGANVLLQDPRELVSTVATLEGPRRSSELPVIPHEALLLDHPPSSLMELALEHHRRSSRWVQGTSELRHRDLLRDLTWLAKHAANAVACDESVIVEEYVGWLLTVGSHRGVPPTVTLDGCLHLSDAVEPVAPSAAERLRRAGDEARALHRDGSTLSTRRSPASADH